MKGHIDNEDADFQKEEESQSHSQDNHVIEELQDDQRSFSGNVNWNLGNTLNKVENNQRSFQNERSRISPAIDPVSYQRRDLVRINSYYSPAPYFGQTPLNGDNWQAKSNSSNINLLERGNPAISNFGQSIWSPVYKELSRNGSCAPAQIMKSNEEPSYPANDVCQDYIDDYEGFDDTSSIHSVLAMEVSSEYIKNDYLSLKNEDEWDLRMPRRLTQFWGPAEPIYMPEPQMGYPMYPSNPVYHPPPPQNFSAQQMRKVRILKQQKSPAKRPTFGGDELVSSYKRQKLEDTPCEFDSKPLEPKVSSTKIEKKVVEEAQSSQSSQSNAIADAPQENKILPDSVKEDSSKSVSIEPDTRPSGDDEEEEKKWPSAAKDQLANEVLSIESSKKPKSEDSMKDEEKGEYELSDSESLKELEDKANDTSSYYPSPETRKPVAKWTMNNITLIKAPLGIKKELLSKPLK